MRTERAILLDDLYDPNTSAERKEEIMSTFPDFMYPKGYCFFAVNDIPAAEFLLEKHMNNQYFQFKKDYLNDPIFRLNTGWQNCHGSFNIDNPHLFLRLLVENGVRLYDYNISSYESNN